ncbi:MAG: 3-hydroxyisobutyrate dehydrogenase [Pseudonocardiales bacterium]|nr:MAG: 3-hydroxyisobutyrate dehydrogenase [Pseudonocardiales bacterium]
MSEVAFLGTGTMGLPMARNLIAAGYSVHAWNRSADRARPLERDGAQVFDDPGAATRGCAQVVTMLADAEAVVETATQALAATDRDTTWIQMSTIGVEGTERCRELARVRGVTFADAPVLGTRAPAEQGKLIVLASGPEDGRAGCEPIFAAVGARTEWLGEAGAGTRLKVVINGWLIGVVGVLAETVTVARALGVDPEQFFSAVEGGPLDLPYARTKGAAMVAESFDDVSFRLALSRKDGDLLLAAVADAGLEIPILQAVVQRLRDVEAAGHGDEDLAATYSLGSHPRGPSDD